MSQDMSEPNLTSQGDDTGKGRRALWALMLLALALRVFAIVFLRAWENPSAMEHKSIAAFLLQGHGFATNGWGLIETTSVQSPTYPWLLAGLFYLFGIDSHGAYAAAMGINAVVATFTVWAIYRLAVVIGATPRVALIAAGLFAVWPTQVYVVTNAQAISLITACIVLVTLLFYRSMQTGKLGPWLGMSVLGCVGMITEPVLLPPMALTGLLVFVWPSVMDMRLRFRNALVLLVAALTLMGPWTARNYLVHDRLMPIKSTFWVNVWKGNNPNATGTDRLRLTDEQREQLEGKALDEFAQIARSESLDNARQYDLLTDAQRAQLVNQTEVVREDLFKEWTQAWISENPGGYARMCAVRLGKTVWIDWDNPKSNHPVYIATRVILLVLTAIGLVLAIRLRWRLGYPAVLLGGALVLYTLTVTAARFILPFEPFALCLSALALERGFALVRGRREDPAREVTTA